MAELRLELDDEVLERLRARAHARGVSLEHLLLERLRELRPPRSRDEALARASAIRARSTKPAPGAPDAVRMIREDRDSR